MDSRTRYAMFKSKYPDKIIVVAHGKIVGGELQLRTFGEDIGRLRWVAGAKPYIGEKGPGLKIKKHELEAERNIRMIDTDVWEVE